MVFKNNIDKLTTNNNNYRKVLYTTKQLQLVLMSLKPKQEIGTELHKNTTQFIRVEEGSGNAIVNNIKYKLTKNTAIIIPNNTSHTIIAGKNGLKIYTIYSPPEHKKNLVQKNIK